MDSFSKSCAIEFQAGGIEKNWRKTVLYLKKPHESSNNEHPAKLHETCLNFPSWVSHSLD